jgi:hypothetical protein
VDRWRTRIARICLMVGLCAWVLGSFASALHELVVQHVVCAEHGELVEAGQGGDALVAHGGGPELRAPAPEPAHDHGCVYELVGFGGVPDRGPALAMTALSWPEPALLAGAAGPRGPPLAVAPKTSPPLAS